MDSTANSKDETTDDDVGVSMVEILEEEERLVADADAVLGDTDDKNCTYLSGYVRRQPLYSCTTCEVTNGESAGICLACSYECHDGHNLIELYTKRSFRCDCGNSKFANVKCKLNELKDALNPCNKYNQNFQGLYCSCKRPYPDPDDEVDDEMLQCVICEDWYHGRHLGTSVPKDYEEMICSDCTQNHDFLYYYSQALYNENIANVDVITFDSDATLAENSDDTTTHATSPQKSQNICRLLDMKTRMNDVRKHEHATFWPSSWRKKLCCCQDCQVLYKSENVSYMMDSHDTVDAYEKQSHGRSAPVSQHTKEMNALSQMNRVQQIELVQGFNDMKSELCDYLKKFADNGKTVREEDIREFFSHMEARKRQKRDTGMQYLCK